jgi:hypothetical protein
MARETLSAKPKILPSNDELFPLDVQSLMLDPKFRRVMLTFFRVAGMFTGSFHSEAGASHFAEGRRSLGFDILRTLETHSGQDALVRILSEDQPKEATNGRRNRYDRNSELASDDGQPIDRFEPGERFLDYGPGEPAS